MSAPGPDLGGIGQTILDGLGAVLRETIDAWWDQSAPVVIGRTASLILGAVVTWIWSAAGPLLNQVQIFTHIPPQWSYQLAPLQGQLGRMQAVAAALVGVGLVAGILQGAFGVLGGKPFSNLVRALPVFLVATAGLRFVQPLLEWYVRFANAMTDALMGPATGLPGFGQMEAIDRLSATGIIGLVYLCFGLYFFVLRIVLIGLFVICYVLAPFALAAGALPYSLPQRFFQWWLAVTLGVVTVQIFQGAALAIGALMLAAPVVTGGAASDAAQDLTTAGIGAGMIAMACVLPKLLLGTLASATGGAGGATLNQVLRVARTVSTIGGAAAAGGAAAHHVAARAAAGQSWNAWGPSNVAGMAPASGTPVGGGVHPGYATVHPVYPGGHVRSILGGAPLALPSPQLALPKPPEGK